MSTHNIRFHVWIRKIWTLISWKKRLIWNYSKHLRDSQKWLLKTGACIIQVNLCWNSIYRTWKKMVFLYSLLLNTGGCYDRFDCMLILSVAISGWGRDIRADTGSEYRTGSIYPSTHHEPDRYSSVCQFNKFCRAGTGEKYAIWWYP